MNQELERYLNDHLAGASGAILMIGHLVETLEKPQAVDFFRKLKTDVEGDRRLLEQLLATAGGKSSEVLKSTGRLTFRLGFLKLLWEGFKPGELGVFEALEMLSLGVQGKRLLWVTLQDVAGWYPEWEKFNFADLESEAIRQRDGVEFWRIESARDTFVSSERRAGSVSS